MIEALQAASNREMDGLREFHREESSHDLADLGPAHHWLRFGWPAHS
jgi:hypothetical protein